MRRRLAHPIVITVTAVGAHALAAACGGASVDGNGGPGDAALSDGAALPDGGDAAPPDGGGTSCPAAPPSIHYDTCDQVGFSCKYSVSCHSGPHESVYVCDGQRWTVPPTPCAKPYDQCTDGTGCGPYTWHGPSNPQYNPPGPCPWTPPEHGATCSPGGFGADPSACGYPCDLDGGEGWLVARCDFSVDAEPTSWQLGACE